MLKRDKKWSFKKSFIPSSITNFNKLVKCPNGKKIGALCYPETKFTCDSIGY